MKLSLSKIIFTATGFLLIASTQASADTFIGEQNAPKDPTQFTGTVPVQFLGINDFHGGLDAKGSVTINGIKYTNAGTAARLAGYLNAAEDTFKQDNPTGISIRTESGDMVGASPVNSAFLQDEPTIDVLSAMNFNVGTLGNHEFDEGLTEYNRIYQGQDPTQGQFKDIVYEYNQEQPASYKIVISNVVDKNTGLPPMDYAPYAIINATNEDGQQIKIGVIGLLLHEMPQMAAKKYTEPYEYLDEAKTIMKYSKILQDQGVHAIIVVAHTASGTDESGNTTKAVADIMSTVNKEYPDNSVDVYFAGHSHEYTNSKVGETFVVQAGYQGRAFDDVIGYYDTTTNDFAKNSITPNVYPVLSQEDDPNIKPDATVQAIVDKANQITKPISSQVIAKMSTSLPITRTLNNFGENELGAFVTNGWIQAAKTKDIDADLAIINSGGLRADLAADENGNITYGAMAAVSPFGNQVEIIKATGAQIRELLNQQYDDESGLTLQLSGMNYTYNQPDANSKRGKVVDIYLADGTPVKDDQTYTVLIPDFVQTGGDGFTAFENLEVQDVLGTDLDMTLDYLKDQAAHGIEITSQTANHKSITGKTAPSENESNSKTAYTIEVINIDGYRQTYKLDSNLINKIIESPKSI